MSESQSKSPKSSGGRFMFPRWANYMAPAGAVAAIGGLLYATVVF